MLFLKIQSFLKETAYNNDRKDALVDKDEFNETMINLEKIQNEAFEFVEDYVEHIRGQKKLHSKEFQRRYKYSPLKYFHKELGI